MALFDVVAVGNAIVDVIAPCDDAFLVAHGVPKGGMLLIDEARARAIEKDMAAPTRQSGGSAANTVAALASLGGRGAFVGKVADDALGEVFRREMAALGADFRSAPLRDGPGTGRCLIHVTPDAQRSMTTYLGAAALVGVDDIDASVVGASAIVFFEGYLFEQPLARPAFKRACALARAAGRKTALTLSDSGLVDRQHTEILAFVARNVDILLANEKEAETLLETASLGEMAARARALCPLTAITRSEKGSVLVPAAGDLVEIKARAVDRVVDTTGAGDAYAAGLLFGLARRFDLQTCGELGALAAAEAISHYGARPQTCLKALAERAGLL
jgi:sugar/nucleoside kinase (ribokinase family)